MTFWRHVEGRPAAKVGGNIIRSGKSKVGKLDSHATVRDQNVLGLEIPVVDADGMAVHDSIQDLKKSLLGEKIITNKVASFRYAGEQVAFWTEFNDHERTVDAVHDADQRHNIGMTAGLVVELDLPLLELALSGIETEFIEGLHRVWNVGMNVDGSVDDPVCSNSQDARQLQAVCQEKS